MKESVQDMKLATAVTGAEYPQGKTFVLTCLWSEEIRFIFKSLPSHNNIACLRGRNATLFLEECPHSTELALSDTNEAPLRVHIVWPR